MVQGVGVGNRFVVMGNVWEGLNEASMIELLTFDFWSRTLIFDRHNYKCAIRKSLFDIAGLNFFSMIENEASWIHSEMEMHFLACSN